MRRRRDIDTFELLMTLIIAVSSVLAVMSVPRGCAFDRMAQRTLP
jgi:hypothetical protein